MNNLTFDVYKKAKVQIFPYNIFILFNKYKYVNIIILAIVIIIILRFLSFILLIFYSLDFQFYNTKAKCLTN